MSDVQVTILQLILVASSILYLMIGVQLREYTDEPAGRPFVVLTVVLGLSGLLLALPVIPGVEPAWLLWGYIPLYLIPVAWAAFVVEYVGYSGFYSRRALPIVSALAVASAAFNLLAWNRVLDGLGLILLSIGNLIVVGVLVGVAGLEVGGVLLLLWSARRQEYVGRWRALLLAAGGGGPWLVVITAIQAGSLVPNTGLSAWVPWSILVVGFAACELALWVVVRGGELFDRLLAPGNVGPDTVFEQLTEPVVVLNREEELVRVNPAARSAFAGTDEEVIGLALEDVLGVDLETLRASPRLERTIDGEEREFEHSITDLTDQHGQTVGHAALLSDVTEREGRKQRIATLRQTRAELERKNERLDEFASVISHDLRNPLSIAQMYLEHARETNEEEDFESIVEAHERMERMIDELLRLARSETADASTEPVSFSNLIDTAWHTAETPGADRQVDVPSATELQADPDLLTNVLENLFRNAAEHNDPPLTVSVGLVGPPDEPTGFYVADDGAGIPPDDRETVFEYGYTSQDDGTGFGLSIVQELVEAHGWEIHFEESAEGGARFEISGVDFKG